MFTQPADLLWSPDLVSRGVTMERIEDVAFTPMPERLRNELITRAYGDLAQEMAGLFGPGDATWAASANGPATPSAAFSPSTSPCWGH